MGISDQELYEILKTTLQILSTSVYAEKFVLKGGSALITKMIEAGRPDLFRRTSDIDLHVTDIGLWECFCRDAEKLLNNNNSGISYTMLERRAEKKPDMSASADSLKFKAEKDDNVILFKIDMNIRSLTGVSVVSLETLGFNAYDNLTMLADKISAVSGQRVYRRIKDLYDICVLSQLSDYKSEDILNALKMKRPDFFDTGVCMLTSGNIDMLKHAYEKYVGIRNKPDFAKVYTSASEFLEPVYGRQEGLIWNREHWGRVYGL